MKIELEFEITKIGDDSVEGTWQTSDEGEQGMMAEFITRRIETDDAIMEKWDIDSPEAHERMAKSLGMEFYNEDGTLSPMETTHGIFTAWEHGVPV